ncbi:MAG: hypothetical protein II684_06020 [Treponema sp.]|nr:hypothetical protein [Treponema sp.]
MVKAFEFLKLKSYIPAELFRIIDKEVLGLRPGRSDILVKIVKFKKQKIIFSDISGNTVHDEYDTVYGYVRNNNNLSELIKGINGKEYSEKEIEIHLHDTKDEFILQLKVPGGERTYFVSLSEVNELMENCLKPVPV